MIRKLLLISFIAFLSFETHAHQISRSFSKWEIEENIAKAVFTVPARQVTLLPVLEGYSPNLQDQLTTHLKNYLKISVSGQPCQILKGPETQLIDNGYVQSKIEFTCTEGGEKLSIYNGTFFPVSAGHIHFARILLDNNDWQEHIFTSSRQEVSFSLSSGESERSDLTIFVDYISLGFEHILAGYDHLAFLATILLITFRARQLLLAITGFTIGHSVTLALASLGFVQPSGPAVEALIGYTILLVAFEALIIDETNKKRFVWLGTLLLLIFAISALIFGGTLNILTWIGLLLFTLCYGFLLEGRDEAQRAMPVITIIFGLIHGFGFAGVLLELGLPTDGLVLGLLGFNIGVELGQILSVFLAVLILYVLGKTSFRKYHNLAYDISGALLIALGTFWFVGRALIL